MIADHLYLLKSLLNLFFVHSTRYSKLKSEENDGQQNTLIPAKNASDCCSGPGESYSPPLTFMEQLTIIFGRNCDAHVSSSNRPVPPLTSDFDNDAYCASLISKSLMYHLISYS